MVPLASVEDVEQLWHVLDGDELTTALSLLRRVSALVRARIPGIDTRLAADPNLRVLAAGVVVDAVVRVLRNPDGFTSEQIGAYSYSRAATVAGLALTDAEWALLEPVAPAAFTIRPWSRT